MASVVVLNQATSKFLRKIDKRKEQKKRDLKKLTDEQKKRDLEKLTAAVYKKMETNYISIPWHFHSGVIDNECGGDGRIWSCIFLPHLLKRAMELEKHVCSDKIRGRLETWKLTAKFNKVTTDTHRRKKRRKFDSLRAGIYWWKLLPQKKV